MYTCINIIISQLYVLHVEYNIVDLVLTDVGFVLTDVCNIFLHLTELNEYSLLNHN